MPAPSTRAASWRTLRVAILIAAFASACSGGASEMSTSGLSSGVFEPASDETSTTVPEALARAAVSAPDPAPTNEASTPAGDRNDLPTVNAADLATVNTGATSEADSATTSTLAPTTTTTTTAAPTTTTAAPTTTTTTAAPTTTSTTSTTTTTAAPPTTAAPAASGDQLLWFWAPW